MHPALHASHAHAVIDQRLRDADATRRAVAARDKVPVRPDRVVRRSAVRLADAWRRRSARRVGVGARGSTQVPARSRP